jgi:hypothetical protein
LQYRLSCVCNSPQEQPVFQCGTTTTAMTDSTETTSQFGDTLCNTAFADESWRQEYCKVECAKTNQTVYVFQGFLMYAIVQSN